MGFALGDVAGKGPPAALLSAMMQGIFAAQAASSDSPSQTISRVNLALYRRGIESRFVTLMYGAMKPDGRLTYCNAGHNPPLIMSPIGSEQTVRRLECGGPIVGLFELGDVRRGDGHAEPGDWLIVFSDGVSEAMSASGDEYGEDRIVACVERQQGARAAAAARGAVRGRARVHARRAAERRHHRDGAEIRRMSRAAADAAVSGSPWRSGSFSRSRSGTASLK